MTSAIIDVINNMSNVFSLKGCSESEIKSAETELNLIFSEEYKDYTKTFGAISVDGKQITGAVSYADASVVMSTISARNIYPEIQKNWYVVHDANIDGLIYWQDNEGLIYKTVPESVPQVIARSLSEYLTL